MKIYTSIVKILCFTFIVIGMKVSLASTVDENQNTVLITITADKQNQPLPLIGNPGSYRNQRRQQYKLRLDDDLLIDKIAKRYGLQRLKGWPIRPLDVYCEILNVPFGVDVKKLLDIMVNDVDIESVQLLNTFSAQSSMGLYNDPYLSLQYNLVDLDVINSHAYTNGSGIKVAIIDSKIDHRHDELNSSVDSNEDYIASTVKHSGEKHGTAVAGLISAAGNNDLGIVGVAPGASLLGLRACSSQADNSGETTCSTFTLAQAITHAIEQKVDIINLSLTGPDDALLGRLIRKAIENNIAVVAAAGGINSTINFPANMPEVIAVQAAGLPDLRSVIFAPGKDLLTTKPGDGFEFVSGSSFAAAQVSGLLALMLEAAPNIKPEQARGILLDASRRGYLNACSLLSDIRADKQCLNKAI